ncbi:hypothetical protein OG21DRAFT_1501308 [Imleria badia]|nr:hypothetical protein OG21DRAFT_1501308 [Imleria badia]
MVVSCGCGGSKPGSRVELTTLSDAASPTIHRTPRSTSSFRRMSTGSTPTIEQEIAQLVVEIGQNLTNTYVNISAISFLLYDVLINLDREVEHIWKARWSISKVLFIIGRYYGLFYITANFAVSIKVGLSLEVCRGWLWFLTMAGDIFFTSIVNVILIMRLYAMYGNRKVLAFFVSLFLCEFAFELYTCIKMGIETSKTVFTIPPGIPLPGCFASPNLNTALWSWIPCMVIATSFFVMTVAKVVSDGYTTPKRLKYIKHISPLIVSMVRDGALYYSLMFAILLITIVLLETAQGFTTIVSMPWLVAIYSLTASRLVLNLRDTGNRTVFGASGFSGSQTMTAPIFAMSPAKRSPRDAESLM